MLDMIHEGTGSSPRMRGKLGVWFCSFDGDRIIPAHAGQTMSASATLGSVSDHPRACGANQIGHFTIRGADGSSPRMRGKRRWRSPRRSRIRIIPAHAGQTHHRCCRRVREPDHPRACGANFHGITQCAALYGSSPRMRGKRGAGRAVPSHRRIIPAHAGQTIY